MPVFDPQSISRILPGRSEPLSIHNDHAILHTPLQAPFPADLELIFFAGGCFWGIEEIFWQQTGVYSTFVGYSGGLTPNPTYEEVCTGRTGHAETVGIVFDPHKCDLRELLIVFWEAHDPTQWLRQGGDIGSQYRSVIFTTTEQQQKLAEETAHIYQQALTAHGAGTIATEIIPLTNFFYAEDYHQQYLHKNPAGYRCHGATGVIYPRNAAQPLNQLSH